MCQGNCWASVASEQQSWKHDCKFYFCEVIDYTIRWLNFESLHEILINKIWVLGSLGGRRERRLPVFNKRGKRGCGSKATGGNF